MLRIGLIGCGYISNKHLKTLVRFDDISLIAVSDIQKTKMEESVQFYQESKGNNTPISLYENYNDMLSDPNVDAVIISVISGLHAEIAKKALKHGKHVMIEKPLALSLKDANEIIDLSQKYNKTVLVCHQLRYRPLIQKIKQLLEKGYFGALYLGVASLRLNRSSDYYASAAWKGTWEKDGGMLVNQGIHLVDILIWLMGDMKSVYGEIATRVKEKETEDVATGIISFENDAKGVIEANTITKPKNLGYYLSIFGEKGSVCIGGPGFNEVEHCYLKNHPHLEEELKQLGNESDEQYVMYQNFLEAISTNKQPLITAQEGKKALEAIFAIYQSDRMSKLISLPLENFSTKDMIDGLKEDSYD